MDIDWSKAPEGATHYDASDSRINSFMKLEGGSWFFWPPNSSSPDWAFWRPDTVDVEAMIPRPKATPWTGEGLPPIGVTCKLSGPTERLSPLNPDWAGREVKIYAHFVSDRGIEMAAYVGEHHDIGGVGIAALFVPIRTPEQIAAEKRKTAIKEMQSDTECHVYADVFGRLYDAGYRKQVTL